MSQLGFNDLKQLSLPQGWDGSELARLALADSTTYEQVVNDITAALLVANHELLIDPVYGGLFAITEEPALEYRNGAGSSGMSERTEYQKPDPRRVATTGHMLPLKSYDRALGWTFEFLRKARRNQIETDISEALFDVRDNWERKLLTRFFSDVENPVGTAGYDVPFIKGGGSVPYTPPPFNGQTFLSTHTHFERLTTGSQATALTNGVKNLWEHGLTGPFDGIIPSADVATYSALPKFIRPDRGVQYVQVTTSMPLAVAPVSEPFVGLYEADLGLIRLWATPRLPTGYLGVYRSYGINDLRNPLRVRYSLDFGAGAVLLRGDAIRAYPLENAVLLHDFGVGVGDRLNGYCAYFAAAGSYAAPTIS